MMPAELMPRTVPMLTDAVPQLLDLGHQLLARHPLEIFVHDASPAFLVIVEPQRKSAVSVNATAALFTTWAVIEGSRLPVRS